MAALERVDVEVEFEYEATEEDELTIQIGDIITDVDRLDDGWWKGTFKGKRGMFPDNFVKVIGETKTKPNNNVKNPLMISSMSVDKPVEIPIMSQPEGNKKKAVRAKVVYPYTPASNDELELVAGDVIDVTDKSDENWWEGELDGKTGVFPSNFVELIDDAVKEIKPKKVIGVGFGDIFKGREAPKLRPTKSPSVESPSEPKMPPIAVPKLTPAAKNTTFPPKHHDRQKKPAVEKAKVLYPYGASNDDELSLGEGEIVNILDKNLADQGWWKGEISGRVGVFPDNFVELIPADESQEKQGVRPPLPATLPPDVVPSKHDEPKAALAIKQKKIGAPPVGKKPLPNPGNLHTHSDDHRGREHASDDHVTLPSQTKDRVKPPNRKPPSKKGSSMDLPEADEHINTPFMEQESSAPPSRRSGKFTSASVDQAGPSPKSDDTEQEIAKLRRDLDIIKSKSVFKEDYDKLKLELSSVRAQMNEQQDKTSRQVKILMEDIDEERKLRANMQIELDRVKKLVAIK